MLLVEDEVVDVEVVVVGGSGRPMTGMRPRHGDRRGRLRHRGAEPDVLLSQLMTVPTSTMLSASVSTQRIVRLSMLGAC